MDRGLEVYRPWGHKRIEYNSACMPFLSQSLYIYINNYIHIILKMAFITVFLKQENSMILLVKHEHLKPSFDVITISK